MPIPPRDPRERAIWYARRIGLTLLGSAVLALGVNMLIFPGPGLLFIPLGLSLLGAAGYGWALRAQVSARREAGRWARRAQRRAERRRRGPRVDVERH